MYFNSTEDHQNNHHKPRHHHPHTLTMSEIRALCCWTAIGDEIPPSLEESKDGNIKMIVMSQESGKKSSFLLDLPFVLETPLNTHLIIEHKSDPVGGHPFFLGGFQIISNAKQYEVYLTGDDQKETYLTTSTGIPFEKGSGENWFKAVNVIPGGPRRITRLHLKLLNVQNEMTRVKFLKLTARIPEPAATTPPAAATTAATKGTLFETPTRPPYQQKQQQQQQQGQSPMPQIPVSVQYPQGQTFNGASAMSPLMMSPAMPPTFNNSSRGGMSPGILNFNSTAAAASSAVTQDDLGAAMAGMSMMARSTEESINNTIKGQFSSMERNLDNKWNNMEVYIKSLTTVVVSQKLVLEENNKIMRRQEEMIQQQARQIAELTDAQKELSSNVTSLQRDISTVLVRSLQQNNNNNNNNSSGAQKSSSEILGEMDKIFGIVHSISSSKSDGADEAKDAMGETKKATPIPNLLDQDELEGHKSTNEENPKMIPNENNEIASRDPEESMEEKKIDDNKSDSHSGVHEITNDKDTFVEVSLTDESNGSVPADEVESTTKDDKHVNLKQEDKLEELFEFGLKKPESTETTEDADSATSYEAENSVLARGMKLFDLYSESEEN